MTALEMLTAALAAKKVMLIEQQAADPDVVLRVSFPNPVVNLLPVTAREGGATSEAVDIPFVAGKPHTLSLDFVGQATSSLQVFVKTAKGKGALVRQTGTGTLLHTFVPRPVDIGLVFERKGPPGSWTKGSLTQEAVAGGVPPVVTPPVEPPPVVVPPPPVVVPPPVEPPPPVVVEPPPVVVPPPAEVPPPPPVEPPPAPATLTMARFGHGSTVDEGASLVTRFVATDAPAGASWEVTGDNSPLSEADFTNSLAIDALAGLPSGVTAAVTGRKVKYTITVPGSYTIDLARPTKADATSESATEQYNLKVQAVSGLTFSGGSTLSDWVRDTSRSPDYVPPAPTVTPSPLTAEIMRGVNLAGAEFGTPIYPRTADIDWCIAQGFKVVRVPFKMDRALLGGSMFATSLNPTFVKEMTRVVDRFNAAGVTVLLDDHSYGRFGSTLAGDGDYTPSNARRWWRMIADQFVGKAVLWDLQNEPHDQNADKVLSTQVASAQGIRESGHLGHCVFAYTGWAGISQWQAAIPAFAKYAAGIENCILGFHSYPDKDSSGVTNDEALIIANNNPNIFVERWTGPVQAARAAGVRLWVGEFATGVGPVSLEAAKSFRAFKDANADVIAGYTWWAAGPWGSSYVRAIGVGRNNGQLQYLV